jgi:hypothetical protein
MWTLHKLVRWERNFRNQVTTVTFVKISVKLIHNIVTILVIIDGLWISNRFY